MLLREGICPCCMLTAVSGDLSLLGIFIYGFVGILSKLGFATLNSGATIL